MHSAEQIFFIYIQIYMYVCIYVYIYMYFYIYIYKYILIYINDDLVEAVALRGEAQRLAFPEPVTPHGACLSSVYCFQAFVLSVGVYIVCYCFPACVSPVYCLLSFPTAVHWTMRMLIVRLSEHTGYLGAAVREFT